MIGKIADFLCNLVVFVGITAAIYADRVLELAYDDYILLVWIMLILVNRLYAIVSAIRSVGDHCVANRLTALYDPSISDVCQLCSGDIDASSSSSHTAVGSRRRNADDYHPVEAQPRLKLLRPLVTDDMTPRTTICGHVFHRHCIRWWVINHPPNCPVCGRWLRINSP